MPQVGLWKGLKEFVLLRPAAAWSHAPRKASEFPGSVMNGDKLEQQNLGPECDKSTEKQLPEPELLIAVL